FLMNAFARGALLLFTAVTVAVATTVTTLYGQGQVNDKAASPANQPQKAERGDNLPVVDFDSPESDDPVGPERRRKKNARYDELHLVSQDDSYSDAVGSTLFTEGDFDIPALPAAQSAVILTGGVTGARAHLSNDKTGIYSEFPVTVEEVLKNGTSAPLKAGSRVFVERLGGAIRYPNGKKFTYRIAGYGMPRVGARYVFFLKSVGEEDSFEVITAYELQGGRVLPLDDSDKFEPYTGMEQVTFFGQLKNAIAGKHEGSSLHGEEDPLPAGELIYVK
ncbi:MAG TPA: hypothetical protein VNZ44_02235, partial [Pyrinomonadaceae bacterium]|nr:hypothetical protein [Pyrinomonadaceae bacterium]